MRPHDGVLVARAIAKRYGPALVLRDVSLAIRAGEVVGVAGPNGSGKSTLGRILLGFARPTSGEATICGAPSARYRADYGVGYEPEESARRWGGATVRELLLLRGDPEARGNADLVGLLGVTRHFNTPVASLSRGQWRIVLSAYAMVGVPRAIVLDEPDSGLDPAVMARLRNAVRFCAARGAAILLFSHHLDELALMADRVLFVRGGEIVGEFAKADVAAMELRRFYAECVGDA